MANFDAGAPTGDAGVSPGGMEPDDDTKRRDAEAAAARATAGPNALVNTSAPMPTAASAPMPPVGATLPITAVPGPGSAVPAPEAPVLEKNTHTSTDRRSRVIADPHEAGILRQVEANAEQSNKLIDKQAELNMEKAWHEERATKQLAELKAKQLVDRENMINAYNGKIADGEKKADEELNRYKEMKPTDYWADRSTGQKIVAGLAMAFGAFGSALNGKDNRAAAVIEGAVRDDLAKKMAAQEKQLKVYEMADGRVKRAIEKRGLSIEDMKLREAASYDKVEAEARQMMASMGMDEAQIEANIKKLGIADKKAASMMDYYQGLRTKAEHESQTIKVETDPGLVKAANAKNTPPAQLKANAALTVMTDEAAKLEKLGPLSPSARKILFTELALKNAAEKNPTLDYASRLADVRKQVATKLKGKDKQIYAAHLSFLDPLVRERTGANAPASEVEALAAPITEATGDRPEDLADKRNRRRVVLESIAEESGDRDGWRQKIAGIYRAGDASTPARAPANTNAPAQTAASLPAGLPPGSRWTTKINRRTNQPEELIETPDGTLHKPGTAMAVR